jgi:hypothetical protein
MRAYTITKTRRARPKAWLGVLALALAVGSLAAPATAGAEYSNSITSGSQEPSGTTAGSMLTPGTPGGYSGAPMQKGDIGGEEPSGTPAGSMLTPGTPGGYSGAPMQKGDIGGHGLRDTVRASDTTLVSGSPASTDDGFDWLSAAIGAAAAMALVALGGAAFLTVRRRTAVAPSPASTS